LGGLEVWALRGGGIERGSDDGDGGEWWVRFGEMHVTELDLPKKCES
jgi:hypothetical protein